MAARIQDFPTVEALRAAYRRSLFTIIGHGIFFAVCCTAAIILRRLFNLPPALLSVAFIVALVLFGADIMRFFALRRRVRDLRHDS